MTTDILINGEAKDTINIADRGLQYGDGLFETMAVRNGVIHLWESHWERLTYGCQKLSISIPNKETIENEINAICKNNKSQIQFIIKLVVTRGEGERGYQFTNNQNTTRILSAHPWPKYSENYQTDGVVVRYCDMTLSENKVTAGIKHLNRLEQVLARNEWGSNNEYQEGLMLTTQGHVVDGTMSNIFAVLDNKLFTPDLTSCGVTGVMRKTVIDIAKKNDYLVYEKDFTKHELEMADELFLTNSVFGIWPIKNIAKTRFTKVGTITNQLQEELYKICH